MPLIGLLVEKLAAVVVWAVIGTSVVITGAGAYQAGRGLSTAVIGAHEQSRAVREAADASPEELEALQRQHDAGQLKQHQGVYDAVDGVAEFTTGVADAMKQAMAREDEAASQLPDIGAFTLALSGPAGSIPLDRPAPLTLVARNVSLPIEVSVAIVSGSGTLSVANLRLTLDNVPAACDRTGTELVCGLNLTPTRAGALVLEARCAGRKARLELEVRAADPVVRCPSQVIRPGTSPLVTLHTSAGDLSIRVTPEAAPQTANSFVCLALSGFFTGQDCYLRDPGFVSATGDRARTGGGDAGYGTPLEANQLRNTRGTVSVGLRPAVGTVGSQFFINLANNAHLDFDNPRDDKYYPFGQVMSGMEVADAIATGGGNVTIVRVTVTDN